MDRDIALMQKAKRVALHERRNFWQLGAILVLVPLVAVLWLIIDRSRGPNQTVDVERDAVVGTKRAADHTPEPPEPRPATPALEPRHRHDGTALASADGHSHSEFKPGDPSHDMSPERLRAYRQNYFIGQIDGAILVKDYEGIRRLNAEYRAEYPDDDEPTRQAYDMIADCLEHKTPELVRRARKFWETRRSSRARRDLRKICLE